MTVLKKWTAGDEVKAEALNRTGVGLNVYAQETPDMTLKVSPGVAVLGGVLVKYMGGNTPTISAPATNPRIDLVSLDDTGTINITAGTEAGSPSAPAYPSGELVLAEIYLRPSCTEILNEDDSTNGYVSFDARPLNSSGAAPVRFSTYPLNHIYGNNRIVHLTADENYIVMGWNGMTLVVYNIDTGKRETRNATSDYAAGNEIKSAVIVGGYLYLKMQNSGASPYGQAVYRYDPSNLSAGGTLMTFSGAKVLVAKTTDICLSSDGTHFYLGNDAGNGAQNVIAKYSLSTPTNFAYVSSITLGSTTTDINQFHAKSNGDFVAIDDGAATIRRFNSSGTLQASTVYNTVNIQQFINYLQTDEFYIWGNPGSTPYITKVAIL